MAPAKEAVAYVPIAKKKTSAEAQPGSSRIIQKLELIESMAETVGVENTAGVRC